MENNIHTQLGKITPNIVVVITEYVQNSFVIKSVLEKTSEMISSVSFDTSEAFMDIRVPFDTYVHILEGRAEFVIDGISTLLEAGHSIIIPANSCNNVKALERFKMISTIIKVG